MLLRCCSDGGVWLRTTREYFQITFFAYTTAAQLPTTSERSTDDNFSTSALAERSASSLTAVYTTRSNHCRGLPYSVVALSGQALAHGPLLVRSIASSSHATRHTPQIIYREQHKGDQITGFCATIHDAVDATRPATCRHDSLVPHTRAHT